MESPPFSSRVHWFRYFVTNIWNQQEDGIPEDQVISECAQTFYLQNYNRILWKPGNAQCVQLK